MTSFVLPATNVGAGKGPAKLKPQAVAPESDTTQRESVELSGGRQTILPPEPVNAPPAALQTAVAETPAKSTPGDGLQVNASGTLAVLETALPHEQRSRDEKFLAKYGPWGVVTGASGGIGAEYARALAEKGMNVVLVARNAGKLHELAQELRSQHGVDIKIVAQDLGKPEGLEQLKQATENMEVGLLVNNAGTWQFGSFLDNDINKDLQSVALNVEAPMVLSHHFAGKMAERGKGGVINVGSGAALHGVPGQAAYSATKGFLQNFTESLYKELKPKGVDVLITNPGPVIGEASQAYDQSKVPLQKVTGRQVADDSLKRLGKGSTTIPGWFNRMAMGIAMRAMPRDMLASIAGYILEKADKGH